MSILDRTRSDELICGPILRKATRDEVWVWCVSLVPMDFLFEIRMIVNGNWQAIGGGLNSTVRLGKNLYVHLAGAKPLGGGRFPAKKILSYDIIDVSDPEATPVSILNKSTATPWATAYSICRHLYCNRRMRTCE